MVIYKNLMEKYLPTVYPEGSHFPVTFTQLSNPQYTASYYTYMWSLVIAKDLFSGFDAHDLLAPGTPRGSATPSWRKAAPSPRPSWFATSSAVPSASTRGRLNTATPAPSSP